jgi:LacI family transcriptional regulator
LIAVALPLLSESEITLVQIIREELARRGGYEVMVLSGGYEALLRKTAEQGLLAGAIGDFMSGIWLDSLLGKGIKVVRIGSAEAPDTRVPAIGSHFGFMGSEAARVLLGSGIQGGGYLGPAGAPDSVRLGQEFCAACSRSGCEVIRCTGTSSVQLKAFLLSLPRPAGLLCASDHLARMAILAAKEAGLSVPADLAVIGVGNSRMESLHAGMPISSFEWPLAEMGRLAGTAMADLLEGKPSRHALVDPLLHERESSLRSASGVDRALAWLKSNPDSGITAGELARLAGMSRRSFETAVRESRGQSPGTILQEMRRGRAERFLTETGLDIATIGRACGYQEAAAFSVAFKRWTGRSPRDFRTTELLSRKADPLDEKSGPIIGRCRGEPAEGKSDFPVRRRKPRHT